MTTVVEMLREHRVVAANLAAEHSGLVSSASGDSIEAEKARVELATLRKAGITALRGAHGGVVEVQFDSRSNE